MKSAKYCVNCHIHKCLYRSARGVRTGKGHDLCLRCYRSAKDHRHAMLARAAWHERFVDIGRANPNEAA